MRTTTYRWGRLLALLCAGLLACLRPSAVHAIGTHSGSTISNVASLQFTQGGNQLVTQSNPAQFRVDEVLNVVAQGNDAGNVNVASPDTHRVLAFAVTNTGNGAQTFRLTAASTGGRFDPSVSKIAFDSNGNHLYDPTVDADYVPGSNDPVLQPDQSITVFVVCDIPSGNANGDVGGVALNATALAGTGAPGTTFTGRGAGGSDLVVGSSRGLALTQEGFVVVRLQVQLVKSQATDPQPQSGSVVTYTLRLDLGGSGSLVAGVITDAIPVHTSYVAGSLKLDGLVLSDQDDGDSGRFTGSNIEVRLGALSAPVTRFVTFQVRLD
jgi:hypothetical protein